MDDALIGRNHHVQISRRLLEGNVNGQAESRQQRVGGSGLIVGTVTVVEWEWPGGQHHEGAASRQVSGYCSLGITVGDNGLHIILATQIKSQWKPRIGEYCRIE